MTARLFHAWRRQTLKRQQLAFFAVITLIVLALTGSVTVASASYADVFAANLNRYLALHRLRSSLSRAQDQLERYTVTGSLAAAEEFKQSLPRIDAGFRNVSETGVVDWRSRIEVTAIDRGLAAYKRAAQGAIRDYETNQPGYYFSFEYAGRIAAYVDTYLERLFRIHLTEGTSQFQASLARQQFVRVASLGGVLVIGILLITFAVVFSRLVATPLVHLSEMAHEMAAGNLETPAVTVPPTEELQTLADAFNTMNRNIRHLVADLRDKQELQARLHDQELTNERMQRSLRETQLLALQAQINPHFLFNTLNNIVRTARKENAENSERLIRSLSSVLRYVLRSSGQAVSMGREMEIVAEYLHLQQVRFGAKLQFHLDVSPSVGEARLPPLTIQPLVENAILHGLEPQEDVGSVTVHASRIDGADGHPELLIRVSDTGVGMDAGRLGEVTLDPDGGDIESIPGIGLRNVRRRLQLHFGRDIAFSIASAPGAGTTVEVRVPFEETVTHGLSHSHSG